MAYSIFSFLEKDQLVGDWLHRKMLLDKLRSEKAKAETRIESESAPDMNVDAELQNYCGALTSINEDLKTIQSLREKEKRLNEEIKTAQMQLQKARKTRKTLITAAVIAAIVIGIAVAVIVFMKPAAPVEQVGEEAVIENVQK